MPIACVCLKECEPLASGIWTAVSGAKAQAEATEMVANNLANVNTDGYKKDMPTFREYLALKERVHMVGDIPPRQTTDKDLTPLDGRDQSFVIQDATYSNFRQGPMKVTKRHLDIALDGPGFLEVETGDGIRFTKAGSMFIRPDGVLVTKEGYPILSVKIGPQDPANPTVLDVPEDATKREEFLQETKARYINVNNSNSQGQLTVTETGEVYIKNDPLTKLAITEFLDPRGLRKEKHQLFRKTDAVLVDTSQSKTKVQQGMLEGSNVNPAEEMVNLINAQRMYEANLKSMKAFDQMAEKQNEVGGL